METNASQHGRQVVVVVAPHPDDETLGCGGTLLRHIAEGDEVHWVIVTEMKEVDGFPSERIRRRESEIEAVRAAYGIRGVFKLGFPTTSLDTVPKRDLVAKMKEAFDAIRPHVVYVPFPGDVHSDHKAVFDSVIPCTKSFRSSQIRRVLAYETLSETEFGCDPCQRPFTPNSWVDISPFLKGKLEAMKLYAGEMGKFPFPRSEEAIVSLAQFRGSTSGTAAAEAFLLIKELR